MKQCKECDSHKHTDEFYVGRAVCKDCYRDKARKKSKKRYAKLTKEDKAAINKYYRIRRKNFTEEERKAYRDRKRRQSNKYRSTEEFKDKHRKYMYDRYHNDVNFRISACLRARLNSALKNDYKAGSAIESLGCSVEELRQHLESQFQEGMTWDNYGTEWHIDHVVPLASFDLSDKEDINKACHHTNLQPLWAEDNLSKGVYYG